MLIKMLWTEKHPKVACKSFWGTDPYFVSPDLAPHARFVTPQCERLIPGKSSPKSVHCLVCSHHSSRSGLFHSSSLFRNLAIEYSSHRFNFYNASSLTTIFDVYLDAFVGPEPPPEVAEGPQNTLFLAVRAILA